MKPKMKDEYIEFISSVPLFASLEKEIIEKIADLCQLKSLKRNEIIFREGDPGDSFYLVLDGHVQIVKKDENRELVMAVLDSHEGFGELSLLVNQPRTATAKAIDDVTLIQIQKKDFQELNHQFPQLLKKLNKLMSLRVSLIENLECGVDFFQTDNFLLEYRLELDPSILDLFVQLNLVAGGQEQLQHCKETAMLAREMCKMLCPMIHDHLFYAGYLHEIGKISIPIEFVKEERKGNPISEDVKEKFLQIFKIATEILKPDKTLHSSLKFIEFMDRDSYKEMPFEAQILRVADDYLMKVTKDYLGTTPEEVLSEMKKEGDSKYNPRVVAALEKTIEKFNFLKVEKQIVFIKQMNLALNYKDQYTLRHSIHTREMSEKIGQKIGLNKREMELLRYSCELHDVGKIHIPTRILCAPRKLTDEEMDIMKMHPIYSAQFFEDIPGMHEMTHIIKHHHEKYDGTGYPDKLKEKKIPLISRIMIITDVFSAMTTPRCYRVDDSGNQIAYSPVKTIEIMSGMKGYFDPELFDVFKEILLHNKSGCSDQTGFSET